MTDHGTDWCNGVETRLAEAEATIAEQAATIERFRALVRDLDNVFGPDAWLWNDCGDSRAAITVADMGEDE